MESRAVYETPSALRRRGIEALRKELGPVATARFIQQYEPGEGDYTAEREKLLEGVSLDEIVRRVEAGRGSVKE